MVVIREDRGPIGMKGMLIHCPVHFYVTIFKLVEKFQILLCYNPKLCSLFGFFCDNATESRMT